MIIREIHNHADRYGEAFRRLQQEGIPDVSLKRHASIDRMTTMRTRCTAAMLAEVKSPQGLAELVARAQWAEWPMIFLGMGANTLFATSFYEGMVVRLMGSFTSLERTGPLSIYAGAGVPIATLETETKKWGMMGFEFMHKVPGRVGGSLAGNAGTMKWGMCDFASTVYVMTRDGVMRTLRQGDPDFRYGYRHSTLKKFIILGAEFDLESFDEVLHQYAIHKTEALKKGQPYGVPSAGCTFKNPVDPETGEKVSAGKIIDECNLKNYRIGSAYVSPQHANFIVNDRGLATGEDFFALITVIRDRVWELRRIELELEVNVVGGPLANTQPMRVSG